MSSFTTSRDLTYRVPAFLVRTDPRLDRSWTICQIFTRTVYSPVHTLVTWQLISTARPILREWSRASATDLRGHSIRALWAEASFLLFSKLRLGVHPQVLDGSIRKQLRLSLGSYYCLSYLLYALRILRNLCSNNVFINLPIASQYRELKKDRFLLARFEIDMYKRYRDLDLLRREGTDGDIEHRLSRFPSGIRE